VAIKPLYKSHKDAPDTEHRETSLKQAPREKELSLPKVPPPVPIGKLLRSSYKTHWVFYLYDIATSIAIHSPKAHKPIAKLWSLLGVDRAMTWYGIIMKRKSF
jgi:hypothetical protein